MMATNYGTDVELAHRGLRPEWPLIRGPKVVLYNIFRRITTDPALPAYGGKSIDLRDYCGSQLDAASLASIPKDIVRVCAFEARALSVRVASPTYDQGTLNITLYVTLREGTFPLVISVNNVTAEILNAANLG
jgi:hypothetical protein